MNKLILLLLLSPGIAIAQSKNELISGPMLGNVELRTATIWAEVKPGATAILKFWKKGNTSSTRQLTATTKAEQWYAPVSFELTNLEMNTAYDYSLQVSGTSRAGSFHTTELVDWDKHAPSFSFLAGSCNYINDPQEPASSYGNDSTIFLSMAKEKSAFMVWLGDNWYTRQADYGSAWGLWSRASRERSYPVLQDFFKSMSQYAIWDDHDYGPNNADKTYVLGSESRKVFTSYWPNPSYGQDNEGIYTKISYHDVDLFLMDDRSFRSADAIESEINGQVNPAKRMWGEKQLDWLKNALAGSEANFKIIVSGSQFVNTLSRSDCLTFYPVEFKELMDFLQQQKVEGVLFLSGDRHHSEIIQYRRPEAYTLYDITASPLTSGVAKVSGAELNHPNRIPGTLIEQQNYARFAISGDADNRQLMVEFAGLKGEKLASWSVKRNELVYKK